MRKEERKKRFFEKFINQYKLNKKFYILDFDKFLNSKDFFKSKIILKCKKCKKIQVRRWSNLKKTSKCIYCENKKLDKKEFEKRFYDIHKNLKLLNDYEKMWKKIKIMCLDCKNEFEAMPSNLISKYNKNSCPFCKSSSFEIIFRNFLHETFKALKFKEQFLLSNFDPKWPRLKFDFYFFEARIAIEIDGPQHFKNYQGKTKFSDFKKSKYRDFLKNKIAFIENIKLIRIPYYFFNNLNKIKSQMLKYNYFKNRLKEIHE